jgi:excisionase family DNA binding protein
MENNIGPSLPEVPATLAPIARLLLTPKQAAAALGISPRLLWSLTKSGEVPVIRLRRAVRYSPAALQQWIARAPDTK